MGRGRLMKGSQGKRTILKLMWHFNEVMTEIDEPIYEREKGEHRKTY